MRLAYPLNTLLRADGQLRLMEHATNEPLMPVEMALPTDVAIGVSRYLDMYALGRIEILEFVKDGPHPTHAQQQWADKQQKHLGDRQSAHPSS